MMSMKKKLHVFHIERPQAIGLQLYYESRDLSLLILLPDEIGGLDQVKPSSVWWADDSRFTPCNMASLFFNSCGGGNQYTLSPGDFAFAISFQLYRTMEGW